MTTELKRMRQLIGPAADWAANDLVIGKGEMAVEEQSVPGTHRVKIGDGVKRYSDLPYTISQNILSVTDFLARMDGLSDDTAAVAAAVVEAQARGAWLYWPEGVALTTASIPGLHTVRHVGPGRISRGSDIFYISLLSTQTNHLYANKITGVAGNDGLSAAQAMPEIQDAVLALQNHEPNVRGTWQINVASGTYLTRVRVNFRTWNPVRIVGPAWVGAPTVILDGTATQFNMFSVQSGATVYTENIKVTNCTDNCIEAVENATLDMRSIHSINSGLAVTSGAGIYIANNSRGTLNGLCLIENNDSAEGCVIAYGGSILSIGQDGTSAADSPTIRDGVRLVHAQHASLIKLRFAYLNTGTYGVYSQSGSRVSHENGACDSVTTCYFSLGPGGITMQETNVTHTGHTALRFGAAVEFVQERPFEIDATMWRLTKRYYAGTLTTPVLTGTTAKTNIVASAMSLLTRDFNYRGRALKVLIYGTIAGVAGKKIFEINGSISGTLRSVSCLATDLGPFICEIGLEVLNIAQPTVDMLKWGTITLDERSPQVTHQVTTDNLSNPQFINVTGQLESAADTITTTMVEVYEAGI